MVGALAPTTAIALLSQTISFATLGSQTYGAAPFTVSATASSGLPVSFASTTAAVCTVSASTVTILAAGTCTIQASQAGDATYAAAPSVSRSFAVAKAAQTITFGALPGKTYGNPPFTVSATASSGLAVTFVSATLAVCTVSGTTVTIVAGGTCTIQARQAGNGNYLAAASVNQSFAVAKASQTISFGALANKAYGNPPFTVSATASSGLAVAFASGTTAVCTVSGSTVTIVTGGTCSIKASQAGNASYLAATTVTQSFAIAKASQTITFGTLANQTYGVAPFTVSATASSGLAVTFSSLSTAVCTVSGSTVTIRAGGSCTIQAAQAGNTSYNAATSVSRSFTVAKASQTISFVAPANQTFGAAPFTVSATASSGLAVTFSSLTTAVCTVSGSTVTTKAAGTCTLQAAQAGNTGYNAATSVSQSFTVAKADQTITFGGLGDKAFGSPPFGVSASASSGLAVTFSSLTAGACTVSGTTVTLVAAGTCTIQAAQAGNGNYNAAQSVTQSFTVGGTTQTINFPPAGNQLLTASPVYLAATASSGLAVTLTSQTPAVCTVSGSYATLLSSGTCTVQATQAGNGTYTAAPSVTRSFVVMEVPEFVETAYPAGSFPDAVAVGEFNGDGWPDLAIANAFSGNVSILLGTGNGSFTAGTPVQTGGEPIAVAVGDFNRDGKLDLAIADFYGDAVSVWAGNGTGAFTRMATVGVGVAPISIAIADFNADGKADLAIANGTRGSTTGQTVTVLIGNGDGSFRVPVSYPTGPSPYGVVVGDFNADAKPDLAVINGDSNTVSIMLGRGDGTFNPAINYPTGSYPDAIAVGDFNGDGKLDLAVGNDFSDDVSIFLGRGDGTFNPASSIQVGSGPAGVAVSDFNGDGWADLATVNRFDDTMALLLGNGDGSFQPPLVYAVGTQPEAIVASDLNGDGKSDLALVESGWNDAAVWVQPVAEPAALAIQSGSSQSAAVGTAYPTPLAVLVKGASGQPLPGISIAFNAPASGASGAFAGAGAAAHVTSNGAGVAAAPVFTANATVGPFTVTASVGALSASFALANTALATQAPLFTSAPPPNAAVNAAYSYAVTASGVPTPTFSLTSGALPTGLALNATTGVISGTPTVGGTFSGTLTASNGIAPAATQAFNIAIALATQTIAFGSLTNHAIGTGTFSLTATASSGLPVTFASATPAICSVVGTVVGLDSAGTCTIRASQPGNGSYAPATDVNRSFTVTRGNQTIAFEPATSGSVTTWRELSATASSGLPVSFTALTPSVCVVSATLANFIATGTCTVRASQAGNTAYNAAPNVDRSIAVAGAYQTIAFWSPDDQPLQASPITISASASSGLPVSFSSLTPTVCTVSGSQVALLASGTCTLRASQVGNTQYAATSIDRSFTVTGQNAGRALTTTITGPFIEYSTYLGGDGSDKAFDVAVGPDGSAYVGGSVASTNFPGLSSAVFTNAGLDLLFVAKINPNRGAADFVTVIGGRAPDITSTGMQAYVGSFDDMPDTFLGGGQTEAMTIDPAGNVYIAAYGSSTDYPVRGGTYARGAPKYIFRVTPTGSVQRVSGAIDSAVMTIRALAIDAAGALYFTGIAGPGLATTGGAAIASIPTSTGAYATRTAPYLIKLVPGGAGTAFATYLSVSGSRIGSLPTTSDSMVDAATTAYALTVDASGNSYLAGQANATDFPVTTGSPDTTDTQKRDAFVAKVNSTGTALLFVARLGNAAPLVNIALGTQGGPDAERATSIALAPDGGIVVGGKTATLPFLGVNSFQPQVYFEDQTPLAERETGFVAKLSADGKRWIFVDPIGTIGGNLVANAFVGDVDPYPVKVAVDPAGAIYAAGTTFTDRRLVNVDRLVVTAVGWLGLVEERVGPVVNGLSAVGPNGAFVMKISADGSAVAYAATLGVGTATGLAVDGFGNAFIAGYAPGGLPTANAVQAAPILGAAQTTPFVAKLNDQLGPVQLATNMDPGDSARAVRLVATIADSRYAGSIEFDEGGTILGTVQLNGGIATLQTNLAVGIHRLRAVFHGSGPFDGYASAELIQVVNQPPEIE